MHSVALLTASYAKDIERFSLLSESIDTWLTGYTRHYVLVNDEDLPLFARFASDKRVIVPASRYLPKWLFALPPNGIVEVRAHVSDAHQHSRKAIGILLKIAEHLGKVRGPGFQLFVI